MTSTFFDDGYYRWWIRRERIRLGYNDVPLPLLIKFVVQAAHEGRFAEAHWYSCCWVAYWHDNLHTTCSFISAENKYARFIRTPNEWQHGTAQQRETFSQRLRESRFTVAAHNAVAEAANKLYQQVHELAGSVESRLAVKVAAYRAKRRYKHPDDPGWTTSIWRKDGQGQGTR